MSKTIAAAVLAVALMSGPAAWAQHPAPSSAPGAKPAPSTGNLQGDQSAWINNPHMHAYYDLTVQAFAAGPAKVDEVGYQKKSYALFADFGASMGMKPEAMVDHLKLIPGQMVKIVREDPEVLKSYPNFIAALMGPQ